MQTVGTCIESIANQLSQADLSFTQGIPSAWDEAVAMVLTVLDLPIDSGDEVIELPVSEQHWQRLQTLTDRRIHERIPLCYLLQKAWFMQLPFYVDERVLIPRSPFGEWIARGFKPWLQEGIKRIAEIGTGSGCMAIGCALQFPDAVVDAVDISEAALSVAQKNIETYQLIDRVQLYLGDGYQPLPPQRRYDLIISNPPYVSAEEIAELPAEFSHEPVNSALFAEDAGLAIVDDLLKGAHSRMTESAILVIEVGFSQPAFEAKYPDLPVIWLECEFGGQGLLLLTRQQLEAQYGR